jgi:hypothetical protein
MNEYQYFLGDKGGRFVGLTNLHPACADYSEIQQPLLPGNFRASPGLSMVCVTFTLYSMLMGMVKQQSTFIIQRLSIISSD